MARYRSPQLSVRTRLSPPYRATIRLKVFHGRNSISWAKSVLPVFIGDSRDHPGSLLRLQIVDTAFCSETRRTPGAQSRWPSVNRTGVTCAVFDALSARRFDAKLFRRLLLIDCSGGVRYDWQTGVVAVV